MRKSYAAQWIYQRTVKLNVSTATEQSHIKFIPVSDLVGRGSEPPFGRRTDAVTHGTPDV